MGRLSMTECTYLPTRWDVWYRQMSGAAQVIDRMSRGVQRGLREMSNARQGSLVPERQRSTPLESSPAVTTAPQPGPVGESFEEFYKSVWDRPLGAGAAFESSGKAPKPPRLPAPPPPEGTSTPGSKVISGVPVSVRPEGAPEEEGDKCKG